MLRALVLTSPPGELRRASAVTLPWPVGDVIPKLFSKTAVKPDEIPSKRRAKEIGFFHRYPLVRKIILVILICHALVTRRMCRRPAINGQSMKTQGNDARSSRSKGKSCTKQLIRNLRTGSENCVRTAIFR